MAAISGGANYVASSFLIEKTVDNIKGTTSSNTTPGSFHKEQRQHRFTIFIGYGEKAGSILKRYEQLKYSLGMTTNIQFLTYIIDYFKERNNNVYKSKDESPLNRESNIEAPLSQYEIKFKTDLPSMESLKPQSFDTATILSDSLPKTVDCKEYQPIISLHHMIVEPTKQIDSQLSVENCQCNVSGSPEFIFNDLSNSKQQHQGESIEKNSPRSHGKNIFSNIKLASKRKFDGKINDHNENQDVEAHKSNENGLSSMEEVSKPMNISTLLTLSAVSIKALKIIHQYMENIKNDEPYYHGYVSCPEKLKNFLDDYRLATRTSFSIRSSRSYIKKRVMNAMKAAHDENVDSSAIESLRLNSNDKHLALSLKSGDERSASPDFKPVTKLEVVSPEDGQYSFDTIDDGTDGSIITGPLRWEFILGKPPIPFTGIPFFIIGNTQYQCFYATADIRTQRRKEKIAKILKENPGTKTRMRRSMKRDCKAVMCIKSIVTFPDFSVLRKLQNVKSKKACRKVKATTLETLRNGVEKGEAIGHPAFWVHIPLPEAHSTHDMSELVCKGNEADNVNDIAHILDLAAQYGGQLEISPEVDKNIVHLKIDEAQEQLGSNVSVEISDSFLCSSEPQMTNTVDGPND